MQATQVTSEMTPCGSPLPELEIPMINTMMACLGSEHRRLDAHVLDLALAAMRLAGDGNGLTSGQAALEAWDEIRDYLYTHLQIEDALVFSWGESHQAVSSNLQETLKIERQEMHKLVASLPPSSSGHRVLQTTTDRGLLAQTLLELARILDMHVARYEAEVLPSIRRALFQR
jgi:Hemerythrin HHE cation binding domain